MNREEAIYFANCLKNNYTVDLNDMEAFCDMAIKALAQEPTNKNDSSELEKNSKKLEKGTTKNDLRAREFEEIVIEFPIKEPYIYPDYKDKPYFGIKYKENEESIVGYGTYSPQVLSRYLKDYFMSTTKNNLGVEEVTALAEWTEKLTKASEDAYNKGYADGMKAQAEPISDILENIYFDIEKEYEDCVIGKLDDDEMYPCFRQITDIYGVLDIIGKYIDKYKPGSEEEDGNDD